MIKKAIAKVVERENLTEGEMIEVMNQIMSGECTQAQIGAFITALRMKGETVEEITGAARVMRERATPVRVGKGVLGIDRDDINVDRETILDVVAETSETSASVRSLNPSSDSFPSEASAMMSASRFPVFSANFRAA